MRGSEKGAAVVHPIITGRGLALPADSLTNADVASMVDRDRLSAWVARNEWCRKRLAELAAGNGAATADRAALERRAFADYVEQRIGIRTRRVVDRVAILEHRASGSGLFASDLGAEAARRALAAADVAADDLDVVICGTSSPDRVYPATAIEIQHRIGAHRSHGYDLLAACSSFVFGLEVARALLAGGVARRVLLVAAEYFTCGVDYRDPDSAFFWGDGAAATVIEAAELGRPKGGYEIVDTLCRSRLSDNIRTGLGGTRPLVADVALGDGKAAFVEPGSPAYRYFYQNGPAVYREVVPFAVQLTRELLDRNACATDDVRVFMFHQASRLILDGIERRLLGAGGGRGRLAVNLDRLGNTSSSGVAICLAEEGAMQPGELACMTAFGAGYTVGSALLRRA
jgi:beta-ketodecanoyl-[acyl-carrier-protein] synthase